MRNLPLRTAVLGSLGAHALLAGILFLLFRAFASSGDDGSSEPIASIAVDVVDPPPPVAILGPALLPEAPFDPVLDDVTAPPPPAGPLVPTVPGPADTANGDPSSPFPNADVDTPDRRAAGAGGGAPGGTLAFTGRHDTDDLRAQPWNDPDHYRLPRRADGLAASAPESIAQLPDPGLDASDRDRRRLARAGERAPAAPAAPPGIVSAPVDEELDPRWDDGARAGTPVGAAGPTTGAAQTPGRATQLAEDGAAVSTPARPLVPKGPASTETPLRGPRHDLIDSAQASNERHPEELEMTAPRAGGSADGSGVAGPRSGPGVSAITARPSDGQGGTPADVPAGTAQPSTRAAPQDPYFRRLAQRVMDRVEYPYELAIHLEQGFVIVDFTLSKDGRVAAVKVTRPSGFREFDHAVVDAVRGGAPYGPVPESVLKGRGSIQVSVPFRFDNPPIR